MLLENIIIISLKTILLFAIPFFGLFIHTKLIKNILPKDFPFVIFNRALLLGCLAVLSVIFFKELFFPQTLKSSIKETLTITLFISFIEAGIIEEAFKVLFFILGSKHYEKTESLNPLNKFIFAALIGLGFGFAENIFYAYDYFVKDRFPFFNFSELYEIYSMLFGRNFTSILAHTFMNAIFAYCFIRSSSFLFSLSIAILIHGLYDFFALPSTLLGLIFVKLWLIFAFCFCIYAIKSLNSKSSQLFLLSEL